MYLRERVSPPSEMVPSTLMARSICKLCLALTGEKMKSWNLQIFYQQFRSSTLIGIPSHIANKIHDKYTSVTSMHNLCVGLGGIATRDKMISAPDYLN